MRQMRCTGVAVEADLWLKSHVKHAVCLIKHQVGCSQHGASLHLDQIDHAPRGAYRNLHTTA